MARLLIFVAAMATLGATAGQPQRPLSNGAALNANPINQPINQPTNLRGERALQALLCNSIGCSDGYTPIAEAWMVECDGDTCEESQCCEAFCSYHACPNNYIPITDAATTMCEDSGCTTDLCCVNNVSSSATSTTATTPDDDNDDTDTSISPITTTSTSNTASPTASPTAAAPTFGPIQVISTARDDDC